MQYAICNIQFQLKKIYQKVVNKKINRNFYNIEINKNIKNYFSKINVLIKNE